MPFYAIQFLYFSTPSEKLSEIKPPLEKYSLRNYFNLLCYSSSPLVPLFMGKLHILLNPDAPILY